MTVLIPAYKPGLQLLMLIEKIREKCSFDIVIVDDGNGEAFLKIFKMTEDRGCTVLTHETGLGRGSALKTGFKYIKQMGEPEGVVCTECDGLYTADDIIRIARQITEHKHHIILGGRRFIGSVPLRSRLAGSMSRLMFSFVSGKSVNDTQTRLRGYSCDMLGWLCDIPGRHFDFEMNVLIEATPAGYSIFEDEIVKAYDKDSSTSHFQLLRELAQVCLPVFKFSATSILSGILDFILLLVIQRLTSNLLIAVVSARVCSSILNYILNGLFVFNSGSMKGHNKSIPRYFILSAIVLFFNYLLMYLFNEQIGIHIIISKLLTEAILFIFSYWSQRKFVF